MVDCLRDSLAPREACIRRPETAALRQLRIDARCKKRAVRRVVEVQSEGTQALLADGVVVDQPVAAEPRAAVADVRCLQNKVAT